MLKLSNDYIVKVLLMLVVLLPTAYCLLITGAAAADNGRAVWHGSRSIKEVALTFDDGPRDGYCDRILDILDQAGVRATFFMVGSEAEMSPDLVMRIGDCGHDLGNHSYLHRNLANLSEAEIKEEIEKTTAVLSKITGRAVHYLRPPGGRCDGKVAKVAQAAGLKIINWSLNPGDYVKNKTEFQMEEDYVELTESLVLNIMDKTRSGDIILLHNGSPQTVAALPSIISGLKEKGFKFVTLTQLLGGKEIGYGGLEGLGEE